MSDKLNSVFDKGFSGIYEESNSRPTMPKFMEDLAEESSNIKIQKQEKIKIPFEKDIGLIRAKELKGSSSRIIENRKKEAVDYRSKIESTVEELLSVGYEPKEIEKTLLRKFPKDQVNRYFEANSSQMLKRYSSFTIQLLKASLDETKKIEESLRVHNQKLKTQSAINVLSSFFSFLSSLKQSRQKTDIENKVSFKRDFDKKELKERIVENNKRNAKLDFEKKLENMFVEFKSSIQSGIIRKEAHKHLVKSYKPSEVESFYNKYSRQIEKIIKFQQRESFRAFNKVNIQSTKTKNFADLENKNVFQNNKKILNYALNLMTNRKSFSEIISSLKKKFEYAHVKAFLAENDKKLRRLYGQLGYVFIDSNIYKNCDEMKKAIKKEGYNSLFSVKACKNCQECNCNNHGKCDKVNLLISNHPLVRSARAARKILKRHENLVPKAYLKSFLDQVTDDSNVKLISHFNLGIKQALQNEQKGIEKKASVQEDSFEALRGLEKTEVLETDLSYKSSVSKIIDDVLNQ